jgi:transcriptional regulator with XRE-family HTH domain
VFPEFPYGGHEAFLGLHAVHIAPDALAAQALDAPGGMENFAGPAKLRRMADRWARTFIREWRKARNLTQARLGDRIDKDPSIISRLERGEIPYSQEWLESLADAMGCEPADLLRPPPTPEDLDAYDLLRAVPPAKKSDAIRILKALAA